MIHYLLQITVVFMELDDLRVCKNCGDQLIDDNFKVIHDRSNTGLCIICYNEGQRNYYNKNKLKYSIKNALYRKSKRPEVLKKLKNCYNCNLYRGKNWCSKIGRYGKVGKTITSNLARAKKCYEGVNRK